MTNAQTYNSLIHDPELIESSNAEYFRRLLQREPGVNIYEFVKRQKKLGHDLKIKVGKKLVKMYTGQTVVWGGDKDSVCGVNK